MEELDEHGLPVWPAAERNKQPILDEMVKVIGRSHGTMLEVAAGTGQHAQHFTPHFPGFDYFVSDCDPQHLDTLRRRIGVSKLKNLMGPLHLDTRRWDRAHAALVNLRLHVIYCANMMHIAPWSATLGLLRAAASCLQPEGVLLTYGPYKDNGVHISSSNEEFDASLRQRDPDWGVRDLVDLRAAAREVGLTLVERRPMPANNSLLVFHPARGAGHLHRDELLS